MWLRDTPIHTQFDILPWNTAGADLEVPNEDASFKGSSRNNARCIGYSSMCLKGLGRGLERLDLFVLRACAKPLDGDIWPLIVGTFARERVGGGSTNAPVRRLVFSQWCRQLHLLGPHSKGNSQFAPTEMR